MKLAAIAAGFFALLPALPLEAQSSRSLTDSDTRPVQGATITVPKDQGSRSGAEALQEQNILLRSAIKSLNESLAISNSEAEAFKRQSAELSMRIEALGLAAGYRIGFDTEYVFCKCLEFVELEKSFQLGTKRQQVGVHRHPRRDTVLGGPNLRGPRGLPLRRGAAIKSSSAGISETGHFMRR